MPRSRKQEEQDIRKVWLALLDVFATVDDVCTDDGLYDPALMRASLGRILRSWKRCRGVLDPEWDPAQWGHQVPKYQDLVMQRFDPNKFRSPSAPISPTCSTDLSSMTERNRLINALRGNWDA
jgi:hypothetical protein